MNFDLLKRLQEEGAIGEASFEKIEYKHTFPLFSLHWEIKTILYLGVLLLSSGLGILIYQHIDSIGHQVILLIIALISGGCFYYCFKQKHPFSPGQVKSPGSFFDYILLLGTLSFLTFVGYLQYQYHVFGSNYGLATFIPMLALFYLAYQFDHLGILSLGITNLALWMGVSITPKQLLMNSDFNSQTIIYTYLLLGLILLTAGYLTNRYHFKKHFSFTYLHFGIHLAFISLLMDYFFYIESAAAYLVFLGILGLGAYVYKMGLKQHSFYFVLLAILYNYIALSSLIINLLFKAGNSEGQLMLSFLYFIGSAIALIVVLIRLNKKIKLS